MDIEKLLDDAETSAGYTPVAAGTYKLKVISPKTKIIERNGIRNLGIALAPVASEDGTPVNGESIYHTLPLEGEFEQTNKDGSTTIQSRAVFFMSFFRKALGLDRDNVKALFQSALATTVGEDAKLTLADGSYFNVEGKEIMGKITVTESNGKEYRNVRGVWAVAAQ